MGNTVHRRAVLQTIALGIGAASIGRAIWACDPGTKEAPPRENLDPQDPPTDDDEFVPGKGDPVVAELPLSLPDQDWENRVHQLEGMQTASFAAAIFTEAAPGVMKGKERSHVPKAEFVNEGGVKKIQVVVNHVMDKNALDAGMTYPPDADAAPDARDAGDAGDAGDAADAADAKVPDTGPKPPTLPHYITTIYLRATLEGKDTVIGLHEFASTDPAPPTVDFPIPAGVTAVTAFEWCTLHGLWAGALIQVQ